MKRTTIYAFLIFLFLVGCKEINKLEVQKESEKIDVHAAEDTISAKFSIEIIDDRALEFIDPFAKIELLAGGFEWTEGPLYIEDGNFLLFSDIPNNKVYKLTAQNDTVTYLHPSGFSGEDFTGGEPGSNGLLLNPQGELVLMQHGNRQVAKMNAPLANPKADFSTLIDKYEGSRLNSPNDACFDSQGNLYFTDPPYGLPELMDDPEKQLNFQGVYCLLRSGDLILLDSTITRPNGIGLSPDGNSLYVAVSDPNEAVWHKYTIESPGVVSNKRRIANATHLVGKKNEPGLPDGLKVSSKGILFATGPGGVWVFDSEGKLLAKIKTGLATANCAFGNDEKRLFMTADDYILAVDLK